MRVVEVQFTPWGKSYDFDASRSELKIGDFVIVRTDLGTEMGKVISMKEREKKEESGKEIKPILRKATVSDIEKAKEKEKQKDDVLKVCRGLAKKYSLPVKLIDVHFSFDGGRITFAFIADGRVDFRDLVKDLTRHFQKSIRLQQLGIRDEAKIFGEVGMCGRGLCCKKFLKSLGNITSDLAELQQVDHRGSDRLSGVCGRLICCLEYERNFYEEMAKKLPAIGSAVSTKHGKGKVVGRHALRQSVDVELEEGTTVEITINK